MIVDIDHDAGLEMTRERAARVKLEGPIHVTVGLSIRERRNGEPTDPLTGDINPVVPATTKEKHADCGHC